MTQARPSLRRDIISAYVASLARVASWMAVAAFVFRTSGKEGFAMLVLARGVLTLLNYLPIGLVPAMIRMLADAQHQDKQDIPDVPLPVAQAGDVLNYESPPVPRPPQRQATIYATGATLARIMAAIGLPGVVLYALMFNGLHHIPGNIVHDDILWMVLFLGAGFLARIGSEPAGVLLQSCGMISWDNFANAICEGVWVLLAMPMLLLPLPKIAFAGLSFFIAGAFLQGARVTAARGVLTASGGVPGRFDPAIAGQLLRRGSIVLFGQLADFLYAPINYILINRLMGSDSVAHYGAALQIDAALMLIVMGLAAAIMPHAALAHAAGDYRTVRRYYIRGTLFCYATLAAASVGIWLLAPPIFKLWLGRAMPQTLAILPLVLTHAVIGGPSVVGRSILLASGRLRAFAAAQLLGGLLNLGLTLFFITQTKLGLKGVVYATIISVTVRCVLWMPPYVLWALRHPGRPADALPDASPIEAS
jgi:O-antigen/teichoic acid export membrane protein